MVVASGSQYAFEEIKTILSTAPVLALPDHSKPFHVFCDASDCTIGCAIMQNVSEGVERVVGYRSRPLNPVERNYSVHNKNF